MFVCHIGSEWTCHPLLGIFFADEWALCRAESSEMKASTVSSMLELSSSAISLLLNSTRRSLNPPRMFQEFEYDERMKVRKDDWPIARWLHAYMVTISANWPSSASSRGVLPLRFFSGALRVSLRRSWQTWLNGLVWRDEYRDGSFKNDSRAYKVWPSMAALCSAVFSSSSRLHIRASLSRRNSTSVL